MVERNTNEILFSLEFMIVKNASRMMVKFFNLCFLFLEYAIIIIRTLLTINRLFATWAVIFHKLDWIWIWGLPQSSVGKESSCNAGDSGLIPGSGRSPGEGNGNSLQHSCLENPMDRGALRATVHGVARVGHNLATKERETEFNKNIANNM